MNVWGSWGGGGRKPAVEKSNPITVDLDSQSKHLRQLPFKMGKCSFLPP